jgi:ribonuclease HI
VQRLACLGITGAMRTTPTAALNVILSLPSLPTYVRREAMATYLRMRDGGAWQSKGTAVGHAEIEGMAEREIPIANLRVPQPEDCLRLERKYSLKIPTREQWLEGEIELPELSQVWYTDGSKMARSGSSGAGVCRGDQGVKKSFSLGTYATVFQAEVFAILMVAQSEEVLGRTGQNIAICSDSQAALRAVCANRTRSALVDECASALSRLAESNAVELIWVPGHSGIPGNEQADELARQGAEEAAMGPEPVLGIARGQVNAALNAWAVEQLRKEWTEVEGCRQSKMMLTGPKPSNTHRLLGKGRTAISGLVGILTGHCRLKRHLALLGIENSPLCPGCGEEDETSFHFLARCEALGRLRYLIFGTERLEEADLKEIGWTDALDFIRRSGRLSRQVAGG